MSFACNSPKIYLYVGQYGDVVVYFSRDILYVDCAYRDIVVYACIVISITSNLTCLLTIAHEDLWKQRKYLQLLLLNVTSVLTTIAYSFFC